MTPDPSKALLEFLKLAPRYLIAVVAFTGLLLFLKDATLESLKLREFAENYRPWLSAVFLLSAILWVIDSVLRITTFFQRRYHRYQARERMIQRLHALTEDEKQILRYYFAKGTRSNTLRFNDGTVQGLEAVRIIYRASDFGSLVEGFAYNISEPAWQYLNKNGGLLDGYTNTYRTDDRGLFS